MKILIADDDPVSRTRLVSQLSGLGYETIAVADGLEAWSVLDAPGRPSLALLDWVMPGLSGPELCRRLRAARAEPYVYVVLLTGRSTREDLVEGLSAGADDYLTKPFDVKELEARLRAGRRLVDLQADLERRVAERTAELSDLYEHAPCGYHSLGPDGRVQRMNATELRWLGYARDEVIGRRYSDLMAPASAAAFLENIAPGQAAQRGESYGVVECEVRRKDGETLWLRVAVTLERDEEGRFLRSRAAATDVTTRKLAERRVEEKNAQIYSVFDRTGDLVHFADPAGRIVYANPAWCRALGYTAEEARRLTVYDVIAPEEHAMLRASRAARLGQPALGAHRVERQMITRSGARIHVEGTASELVDDGRRTGTYVILHDVTARRDALDALQQAKEHAEAASRAKSAFLANMSHEIRTPMNVIVGHAQLCRADPTLGAEHRKQAEAIEAGGRQLVGLLDDILDLARVDGAPESFRVADVDVDAMIDDLRGMFQLDAERKGLAFAVEQAPDLPSLVRADERRLRQILVRLIGNAVKFTPSGAVTALAYVEKAGAGVQHLIVEVTDTGPGIDPADLAELFQPFGQPRSGAAWHGGAGLGLALSRELARRMGGDVTVRSRLGEGSTFRLQLPVGIVRGKAPSSRTRRVSEPTAPRHALSLPAPLRAQLEAAAQAADYDGLLSLIERLAPDQAAVGDELREQIERFDYDAVQRLLCGS